jgi:hypothetical protein
MILPENRIKQENFANLTDYSLTGKCPKGCKSFFCFIRFEDDSEILWSNIFAQSRQIANILVFQKFIDCMDYVTGYSLQESEY